MAAGLGFKTFTTGEVLTAADTNGYLMQGVLVFASAAARDAAITSPQEGQCCYLKDTDAVLTYSGAAWVGFDDSNAIQNSIVDAKGDLVAASGADTPARLAVGSNGETLVADSSTSTGLRYQPSTGRNFALNSDFTIWQRGTTITPTTNGGAYCADRWFITRGSNTSITATQQTAGNLSTTPNQAFRYYARVQRTAASTTTSNVDFGQMFETSQVTLLAGQTVTFSGYIRKGANFSATSDVIKMQIIEGTGTDQKQMDGGYTGGAFVVDTAKTLTSSWQRFSVTGTVATTSTEITIKFSYTPTGTAGAADYFDVVGAQLELGSVPTAWNLATGTLQGELDACMRYYQRIVDGLNQWISGISYYSSSFIETVTRFVVPMRIAPSLVITTGTNYYAISRNGGIDTLDSLSIYQPSTQTTYLYNNSEASGTAGHAGMMFSNNASSSIAFSAEL